jgi:hypothetical protein
MTLDVDTTIQLWRTHHAPPLNLRLRRVERHRDLHAAEGILLATVTGVAIIAWTVALIRWLL